MKTKQPKPTATNCGTKKPLDPAACSVTEFKKGDLVYVQFLDGPIHGWATGETRDGKIGVVCRELCGSEMMEIKRFHDPDRVTKDFDVAAENELMTVVNFLELRPQATIRAALRIYDKRQNS